MNSPASIRAVEKALHCLSNLQPFHQSSHAVVFRLNPERIGCSQTHFLKLYPQRTFSDQFKACCRGTHALRVCHGNRLLRNEGFIVPRIAGVGRLTHSSWGPVSFVLETGLGGLPLPVYLDQYALPKSENFSFKRNLLRRLAWLVKAMHQRGICHGDLHGGNILISGCPGQTERPVIAFMDTLRTRRRTRGLSQGALEDLKQLNQILPPVLSWADRLAFLEHYLPNSPLDHLDLRSLTESLTRRSEQRLSEKGRSLLEIWNLQARRNSGRTRK